jgi:glycine C-acetyltransferase
MAGLERALAEAPKSGAKLIVTDAVFSMDGDIINLPEVIRLASRHEALLMVDEAHSLGVLGKTGRGILEHFGLEDPALIDIHMGTLSKTIPSIGGFIAGSRKLIAYLKHRTRSFIFSAALPPPAAAAARAAFRVILGEPQRLKKLRDNVAYFLGALKARGFNTLNTETPIVPIVAGDDDRALRMAKYAQDRGVFVLPIISPAVPPHTSRLRANVTAAHSRSDIDQAMKVFEDAGRHFQLI